MIASAFQQEKSYIIQKLIEKGLTKKADKNTELEAFY